MKDFIKNNKKIIIMGGVLLIFVIILIVLLLITKGGGVLSYENLENRMIAASKSYLLHNESSYPKDGESIELSYSTIENSGYIRSMEKILPENSVCSGSVIVSNNNGYYLYSPKLNCGNDYHTKLLKEVIASEEKIVVNGEGLYAYGDGYIYKGENVNNYILLGTKLWIITEIDSNGNMKALYYESKPLITEVWDDRFNVQVNKYVGVNDYNVSRIKDTLINQVKENTYLDDNTKQYAVAKAWCIGKRSLTNVELNTNEECSVASEKQLYGLLSVVDVSLASIDENCKTLNSDSCSNYNYFTKKSLLSWTMTASSDNNKVFYINSHEALTSNASSYKRIVPVIYIDKNVVYSKGVGSADDPYIIK